MTGELVAVDESAKTLAIKTASEGEVKFSYSDKTEIVGADKVASGLAGVRHRSDGSSTIRTARQRWPRESKCARRNKSQPAQAAGSLRIARNPPSGEVTSCDRAAVQLDQVGDDGQAETRARRRLVGPDAALQDLCP